MRLSAYRIAEEALTNAAKHADDSIIEIKLNMIPEGWLHLSVDDTGPGFDSENVRIGLGTLMMQDYAEMVGGHCVISSVPGRGTSILATLPLEALSEESPEKTKPSE